MARFGTMRLQVGHWMHSLHKSDAGLVGEWRLFVICGGDTTLSASTCVVQQVQVHIPGESCLSVDRTDEPFLFARTSHQTVTSMTIEVVFHERINRYKQKPLLAHQSKTVPEIWVSEPPNSELQTVYIFTRACLLLTVRPFISPDNLLSTHEVFTLSMSCRSMQTRNLKLKTGFVAKLSRIEE